MNTSDSTAITYVADLTIPARHEGPCRFEPVCTETDPYWLMCTECLLV